MTYPPNLKTAMTPFPFSVELDTSLREAGRLMQEHNVHHLPVTQDHKVVGVLTDRDLETARAAQGSAGHALDLPVRDVCVPDPYIVDLNEPIDNVLLAMADRHIDAAIVMRRGRLAGVFTWVDACRAFGDYMRAVFPHPDGGDAA